MEKVKEPKRATRILGQLEELAEYMRYYVHDEEKFRKNFLPIINEIEEYIHEISTEDRLKGIRIAKKFQDKYERKLKEIEDDN